MDGPEWTMSSSTAATKSSPATISMSSTNSTSSTDKSASTPIIPSSSSSSTHSWVDWTTSSNGGWSSINVCQDTDAKTTAKTVYIAPTGICLSGGAVPTITVTRSATTVTVTARGSGSSSIPAPDKCLSDDDVGKIVNNFIDLLEYTSYNGTRAAPGRGYHYNVSAITLAPDLVDISDSINFMAGFPLGLVTFPDKTAFDYGQGVLQPEVSVTTLNIFHDCKSITWRWSLSPVPAALPVTGINYMIINDKGLIQKNYAEFDTAAWLTNFGQACTINPPPTPISPPAAK